MTMKFTDFAIGKKLAVVLSGCTLLVVCLSGLSLWDYQETGKFQEDSHDRLAKCLLADEEGAAQELAERLDALNRERRAIEAAGCEIADSPVPLNAVTA